MFSEPINIFNTTDSSNPPIRLSYQRGSHYNSIVDPHNATVGVGLGLPNFSPGSADKKMLTEAVRQSEDYILEQVHNIMNQKTVISVVIYIIIIVNMV